MVSILYTLYFLVQTSSARDGGHGFRGKVLLDNFKIEESYDFMPDADVRKRKGPNNYGIGDLTKPKAYKALNKQPTKAKKKTKK